MKADLLKAVECCVMAKDMVDMEEIPLYPINSAQKRSFVEENLPFYYINRELWLEAIEDVATGDVVVVSLVMTRYKQLANNGGTFRVYN